jgi:hypothetical protein
MDIACRTWTASKRRLVFTPDSRRPGARTLDAAAQRGCSCDKQAGAAGFFVKGTDTQRLIEHLLAVYASRDVDATSRSLENPLR